MNFGSILEVGEATEIKSKNDGLIFQEYFISKKQIEVKILPNSNVGKRNIDVFKSISFLDDAVTSLNLQIKNNQLELNNYGAYRIYSNKEYQVYIGLDSLKIDSISINGLLDIEYSKKEISLRNSNGEDRNISLEDISHNYQDLKLFIQSPKIFYSEDGSNKKNIREKLILKRGKKYEFTPEINLLNGVLIHQKDTLKEFQAFENLTLDWKKPYQINIEGNQFIYNQEEEDDFFTDPIMVL